MLPLGSFGEAEDILENEANFLYTWEDLGGSLRRANLLGPSIMLVINGFSKASNPNEVDALGSVDKSPLSNLHRGPGENDRDFLQCTNQGE